MVKKNEAATDGTELVPFDPTTSAYPALFDQGGDFAEALKENFGDDGFQIGDLDRIKIPAGGGTAWDILDEDPVRNISGVIIHWQPTRTYWEQSLDDSEGGGAPPDCASRDGQFGNGTFGPGSEANPSGRCASCPMNVFGSDSDGKGKACKEQRQLFLLREGGILPVQVALPVTSIQPLRKYMLRLTSKGKPFYSVTTNLALKQVKGTFTYSVVEPSLGAELTAEETAAAKAYGESIRKSFDTPDAGRTVDA